MQDPLLDLVSNINSDMHLDWDTMPPFPVVDGECDTHFKVNEVFGYFIHHRERSSENYHELHVTRVECLTHLKDKLVELDDAGHEVENITRRFFWDLDTGNLREWPILVKTPNGRSWMKTEHFDRSRIFCFDVDYLYSLNREYMPTRYGGKTLSSSAKGMKDSLVDQSWNSDLDGWMKAVREQGTDPCLSFELVSEFNSQFNRRDASNIIKIPEDGICEGILEINDARNYFVSNRKLYTREENERLYLRVSLINYWM